MPVSAWKTVRIRRRRAAVTGRAAPWSHWDLPGKAPHPRRAGSQKTRWQAGAAWPPRAPERQAERRAWPIRAATARSSPVLPARTGLFLERHIGWFRALGPCGTGDGVRRKEVMRLRAERRHPCVGFVLRSGMQGSGVRISRCPATVIGTNVAARHCPHGREGAASRTTESQETSAGSA